MDEMRRSWNVSLLARVEGRAQRYKGNLVLPCSEFGSGHDQMPGGGYDHDKSQGGIVFENEKVALQLCETLEDYFKRERITISKDVYGWFWRIYRKMKLKIRCKMIDWKNRKIWKNTYRFRSESRSDTVKRVAVGNAAILTPVKKGEKMT